MKKVRVMSSGYGPDLERMVNDFIKDKVVTDIQYQAATAYQVVYHSAMIIYEDDDND